MIVASSSIQSLTSAFHICTIVLRVWHFSASLFQNILCVIPELDRWETYLYDAATRKAPNLPPRNARFIVFSSPSKENTSEVL